MNFVFDGRPSDSSYVEAIWRTQSVSGGTFTSVAASNWEMVVTKQEGKTRLTVRGLETKAGYADQPHLTRALKHFAGQTPAQIVRASKFE